MNVWLSGPTGSGKTTLARVFGTCGYSVVNETLPSERFAAFASDPKKHCARLQEDIMRSRWNGWSEVSEASNVIFDRSLDEDARVFCRMHHDLGLLDDDEYEKLQNIAEDFISRMPVPDLIIFMAPARTTLANRVTARTHPDVIVRSLDTQLSLYSEWLGTRSEEVLKIDNSGCQFRTLEELLLKDPRC